MSDHRTGDTAGTVPNLVAAPNLVALIGFCWHVMFDLRDCLEDIEGADGRLENLKGLRWKLLAILQSIEASVAGDFDPAADEMDRVARLLQAGAPTFGIGAGDLTARLGLDRADLSADELRNAMLEVGNQCIESLPGQLPAALGSTGQRELLRAMRMWSDAAKVKDSDLGFLAERFQDLAG